MLGDRVAVMPDDLEGIGIAGDEAVAAGPFKVFQNLRGLEPKPLSGGAPRAIFPVQLCFECAL